jgi:hypothetical protein
VSDFDNDEMAEALKKYEVNLADLVRDTNADTMIRVASLMEETCELAIKMTMLKSGQKVNERMFKHDGELATLEKKINKAKELKLIDDVAFKDAHLLRKIRNKFAHRRERLSFDSQGIVQSADRGGLLPASAIHRPCTC